MPEKPAPAAKAAGEYVVLIGAFANEANVKNLKAKLGEQGIKTISEPLDTPQGKKTRLRAGPFASKDAADKALDKIRSHQKHDSATKDEVIETVRELLWNAQREII